MGHGITTVAGNRAAVSGAEGSGPVGLSYGHISPGGVRQALNGRPTYHQAYSCRVAEGARLVKVRASSPAAGRGRHWTRGYCAPVLTRQSRSRLLQLVNSVNLERHRRRPLFITLTYPADWPTAHRVKRDLDAFGKAIKRGWWQTDKRGRAQFIDGDQISYIWRLEEQERGAPHYHLLVFGIGYIDRMWLSKTWARIVGSGDAAHERAGTNVERPDYWSQAGSYVAKYIAKPSEAKQQEGWVVDSDGSAAPVTSQWGRLWGVHNRKALPVDILDYDLPEWAFEAIKDALIQQRDDEEAEGFRRAPYRGLWSTCGPGPVRPILKLAGLITEGE